ncbi:F-box domain containing protein [Tanacetum coccineum]
MSYNGPTYTKSLHDCQGGNWTVMGWGLRERDVFVWGSKNRGFQNEVALNGVYEGNVVSAKDAGLDVLIQVACDGMGIDKADGYSQREPSTLNALIEGVSPDMLNAEVAICSMGFQNEVAPNAVYEGNVVSDKEAGLDVLIQVACDGMGIDKADGYSQHEPSTMNALIEGFDSQNNNMGIDFLQHDDHVDCSVAKPNDHSIADIGVKLVHENEFSDDFMDVLNDEESLPKVSLDDMNVNEQEEKLIDTGSKFAKERNKRLAMDVSGQPKMRSINELMTMEVFVEQLSRPQNCKKDKVSMPDGLAEYLQMEDPPNYRFPWGYRDITVDREFWLVLACIDKSKQGWLKDCHIDLWVDLMWCFRQPDADWAMVSPHFLPCTLGGNMIDCYSNDVRHPVTSRDVEKSKGIAVERYEITYKFPTVIEQADLYGDCGIWIMNKLPVKSLLQFRTISKSWNSYIDSTAFFFNYDVRKSVNDVFYLTYNHGRLGYMIYVDANLIHTPALANLLVSNLKPVGTSNGILCFSYGNNMMVCIANPSIGKKVGVFVPTSKPDGSKILLGFGVRPDNLDPTVLKFSYPSFGEGNWFVHVFTLSALRWYQLDMNRLPHESIRFKRSTQAVVGEFIYWVGYERVFGDSGDSYKHYLLVSFDMINHRFQEIAIPNLLMRGLDSPLYVSKL